ncbi:MAG TPA: ABC transporter permease [Bryobacteraceae bacterium]|nr:ABC transporter permease [Bryobacteraceae bacterium]
MFSDLKYTVRMLRRNPAFALVVVLLLALGIGLTTAMFSVLDAWLLEPLHFPQAERLAIILKSQLATPTEPNIFVSYRDWEELAKQSRSFTGLAAVFWRSFEADPGSGDDVFGMIATANLFDVLQTTAERGRAFRLEDANGPPVAVIGHQLWQERFGGARDIIGKVLRVSAKSYRIIGVMPPSFGIRIIDQAADTQFYALIQGDERLYSAGGAGPVAAIGRLKPGVTIQSAQQELAAIQRILDQRYPDNPKGFTILATNLQRDNTRNVRASLWLATAAVAFVLLIVCANVGSLLLGHGLRRQREMAVRAALGGGRGRIVRQLLTESALIAMLGGGAGVALAYAALRIFVAVNPFGRTPPNPIALDWRALMFTLLATVVCTLACGLAPAVQAARANLNEIIKASGRGLTGGRGALRARAALVVGQVALSLVLLVGATLMIETLAHLESHPLGFRIQDISVAEVNIPRGHFAGAASTQLLYDRLADKLKTLPGVEAEALSDMGPLSSGFAKRFSIEGQPEVKDELGPKAGHQAVTPGYFATLGIPISAGRSFTGHDDEKSARVAIVNQTAARRWFAGRGAVGARLRLQDDHEWRTVVGVAGDTSSVFYNTVDWLTEPRIILPMKQTGGDSASPVTRQVFALVRGRPITAETARSLLKSIDPALRPGRVREMRQVIAEAVRQPALRTRLLGTFAALSLLLAAIGIYGVMAQSVVQRTEEIGVRVALGAQTADLVRLVVGQGLRLAAIGIAAGVLAAMFATRILASLLYGVKPADPLPIIVAALALLAAVLLASLIPARTAAAVDPLLALRRD